MIQIMKANQIHIDGIAKVCSEGYRSTYGNTHSKEYIERIIQDFYNNERIYEEVKTSNRDWGGYFVAVEEGKVVGAGGGGMIDDKTGEIFVLYLDPTRRNEGIGTELLNAITKQQKEEFGAKKQWVSVQKGNLKGIPFYEARGFKYKYEKDGYANSENDSYISLRYFRDI